MRLQAWPLLGLTLAALAAHEAPLRAQGLTGRLAYLQKNAAWVQVLPTGKAQMLPGGRGASGVFVAPVGGAVLYTVPTGNDSSRVWLAYPPYKKAAALKLPAKIAPGGVQWSGDATRALIASWDKSYLWTAATNRIQALPGGELTLSRDGKLLAIANEKELRLRDLSSGKERVLFSIARPQSVFEALKRAKHPKNVEDLNEAIDAALWKDSLNWRFGSCAFARDNSRLFWICNAGTGAGAAGNTTYCWFSTDLKSGRTEVLSKLGTQFSRPPGDVQLSSDGTKLLYSASVHSSAIENPVGLHLLDLLTQKQSTFAKLTTAKNADTNLLYGACFSPDGRAVAASAFYYSTADALKNPNLEPRDADFTLFVRDLKNRTLKTIKGAVAPSWGK